MRAALALVVLVLAPAIAAAPLWPAAAPSVFLPHPSIVIQSDADFDGPLSGVRRGSGTAGDPYVISDWLVVPHFGAAVYLRNTTKHVVIENLVVHGATFLYGVMVINASNVVVRGLTGIDADIGLYVEGSKDVALDGAFLPTRGGIPFFPYGGVIVRNSERVDVRGVDASGSDLPIGLLNVRDLTVRDSSFRAGIASGGIGRLVNATFENVVFDGFDLTLQGVNRNVSFVGGEMRGDARFAVWSSASAEVHGLFICGSTFRTTGPSTGLHLLRTRDVLITGNTFSNGRYSAAIQSAGETRVVRNLFAANEYGPSLGTNPLYGGEVGTVVARENSFLGVRSVAAMRGADVVENWWGSADGPSDDGPGNGTRLVRYGSGAPFAPWLTEAPDLRVDCAATPRPWE